MLSDALRNTLVALQDQIQAQAFLAKNPGTTCRALDDAQRRLAQHPKEHREILHAMRWAAPGITVANLDEPQLEALLAYQPPAPGLAIMA